MKLNGKKGVALVALVALLLVASTAAIAAMATIAAMGGEQMPAVGYAAAEREITCGETGTLPPPPGCAGEYGDEIAAAAYNPQQPGIIRVSGQGRVSVTPDIAVLMLGTEAQADTVAEARGKAAEAMEAVMAGLKYHGVAGEDIQTIDFCISQVWEWDRITGERKLAGFRVINVVSAKIRVLDKVGPIIDAVAEAGGDLIRIHGVGFTVEDPTAYQKQARENASADAKARAEQLTRQLGVTLGRAIYITEGVGHLPPMPMPPMLMAMDAMVMGVGPAGFPTPIMPGALEIVVNVQVAFVITE